LPTLPFLFDAVLFDLDGTLVATDRFWVDAARAGARRVFAELGIERAMPTAQDWMSLVGLPIARGFERLFPEMSPADRALVMSRCEEEEHRALRAGGAALLPGVAAALEALRARGVRLGIASNCGQDYLTAMLEDLGLESWVDEARCLDSAGVRTKADMVADLLERFGTRAAVFVGDRLGDRDAAWENGLPHVHSSRGFAPAGEDVQAEATIEGMDELVPLLERRSTWIEQALAELRALEDPAPATIGITGPPGAGKSLFARDAARVLAARGRPAIVVALEDCLRAGADADLSSTAYVAAARPLDLLPQGYDLEELDRRLAAVPRGTTTIVHGPFLAHPVLRPKLARLLHLDVDESTCLRRLAGRDARSQGPELLLRLRRQLLPASRGFDAIVPPGEHADLVLDARNPLGTRPVPLRS